MGARRRTRATFAVLLSTLTAAAVLAGPSAAGQPPQTLEEQIAAADADLKAAQAALARTFAAFTAAEQRHQRASASAKDAAARATRAGAEASAAAKRERELRVQFDEYTSASLSAGTGFGSVSLKAFLGSDSPANLLDRATMLDVLAGEYNDVLASTRQAVNRKSAAERQARASLDKAVRDRDAAARAKTDAERAYQVAVDVQDEARAEADALAERRATLAAQSAAEAESSDEVVVPATGPVVRPAQGTLTSTYGARWGTIHYGIDIANSIGTPILSAMAGQVIDSGPASGFGLWVRVQHAGGLITVYGHINESLVSVGQRVAAGEQIATMGNRGQSTGPHLHFEVHQDGNKIDPLPWLNAHGVQL